jgi:hypothetical protein
VAIQHDDYERSYTGTNDHDVVSAINSAIAVLKGQPVPAPFKIRDKKEALFMLAHFVGDLHQPLHVGAIYLDVDGQVINPDAGGPSDPATETRGGNSILERINERCEGPNLHAEWDAIPEPLGVSANPALLQSAGATPKTAGPVEGFAAVWASETIREAHKAFAGLTFTEACNAHWLLHFADHHKYEQAERDLKEQQLARAGARLAELLNAIWP